MNIELKENTLTPEEFIRLRVDAGFMEVPYAQAEKAMEKVPANGSETENSRRLRCRKCF